MIVVELGVTFNPRVRPSDIVDIEVPDLAYSLRLPQKKGNEGVSH